MDDPYERDIPRLKLLIPTFNANLYDSEVHDGLLPEFGAPYVAVLVQRSDGLRVVLGSHDYSDMDAPDVHVERQPNGWAIFIHPLGFGGDPCGIIYLVDDGRSFLLKERAVVSEYELQVVEHTKSIPGFHGE